MKFTLAVLLILNTMGFDPPPNGTNYINRVEFNMESKEDCEKKARNINRLNHPRVIAVCYYEKENSE